jgi:N6-adenosine-specific RNA methylase IME4
MKYRAIVIDPPWDYPEGWPAWNNNGNRKPLDYSSMTVEMITALPIFDLAEHEGYVFLWVTSRYLEQGFFIMRSWRCVPRQTLVWCKRPRGQGPGGMFATTTEFIIVGQRIGPNSHARGKRTNGKINTSWFEWPRGKHSQKPEAFQDIVQQICPGPYLEMFARRHRLGWDVWGNEVENNIEFDISL